MVVYRIQSGTQKKVRNKRIGVIIVGLLITLVVLLAVFLFGVVRSNGAPLFSPPGLASRLSEYLTSNEALTEEGSRFPELSPILISEDSGTVWLRVLDSLEEMGLEVIESSSEELRVRATETTNLWKFVDDFKVEVIPQVDGGSEIKVHSESRVGLGDFGANVGRVLRFRMLVESSSDQVGLQTP